MKKYVLLLMVQLISVFVFAQSVGLKNGPLVGYVDVFEAMLWVQTTSHSSVKIAYWPKGTPTAKHFTQTVVTSPNEAFVAKLLADSLQAGTMYEYEVWLDGKPLKLEYTAEFETPTVWRFRTDPPEFKFAMGSCAYINDEPHDRAGKPYGGDYQIFKHIHANKPKFMLWLGDNIYLRGTDWNTWTGITNRYTHSRNIPEIKPLLANTANYAIWDDHDAGPNDCDGGFYNIDETLRAFYLFWANPTQGVKGIKGTITQFSYGDADFFLLDNRYHRTPDNRLDAEKTILGKEQLEWLKNALASSEAKFRFVIMGGQFLTSVKNFETYSNFGFDKERKEILDFLDLHKLSNVFFITGDRHHTELSKLVLPSGITVYDLTVSPLTAGPSSFGLTEKNEYRMDGTVVQQRNFATIQILGKAKERKLLIEVKDSNGLLLWTKTIISE